MAISTLTSPTDTIVPYNQLYYKVRSDRSNILRAVGRFAFDTTINLYHDVIPATTGDFQFNFGNISRYEFDDPLFDYPNGHTFKDNQGSCKLAKISFDEVYLSGGVPTETTTNQQYDEQLAVSFVREHTEDQDTTVFFQDNSNGRFLTNMPDGQNVTRIDFIELSFLTDQSSINYHLEQYDKDGVKISNLETGNHAPTNKYSTLILDVSQMLSNCSYFDIHLVNPFTSVDYSETFRFYIVEDCNNVRVCFKNNLGAYDHYTFTGDQLDNFNIRSEEYIKFKGYNFGVKDREKSKHFVDSNKGMTVFTGNINNQTAEWLKELIESDDVYVIEGGEKVPIVIVDQEFNRNKSEGLFNLRVSYEYSNA